MTEQPTRRFWGMIFVGLLLELVGLLVLSTISLNLLLATIYLGVLGS